MERYFSGRLFSKIGKETLVNLEAYCQKHKIIHRQDLIDTLLRSFLEKRGVKFYSESPVKLDAKHQL
jgi:hypothetical protein